MTVIQVGIIITMGLLIGLLVIFVLDSNGLL